MKISFVKSDSPTSGRLVVTAFEDTGLSKSAKALDEKMAGGLAQALKLDRFRGKKGAHFSLTAPAETGFERLHVVGLGPSESVDAKTLQEAGGGLYARLARREKEVTVRLDSPQAGGLSAPDMSTNLAFGARLASFRFDKYRTKEKDDKKPRLKTLRIAGDDSGKARAAFRSMERIADGVFLTRDLVSEPANILNPKSFVQRAKAALQPLGVKIKVLDAKAMAELKMGALLGVAQGSANAPRLMSLEWDGRDAKARKAKKDKGPVAFIGKGVTFDSGGISIKGAAGMEDMKWDMGGAGVVAGLMAALAGRKAKTHVVGVVGLVENMPSGTAQRPGDVVTSMSGQTIEVLNTDAEGRLVLADALHYCKKNFKPRAMIDLATLTGAIIVSLGYEKAGLFANDEALAEAIYGVGEDVGERVWRLPLDEAYDRLLASEIADMKNIGGLRLDAGAVIAAQFLKRFVGDTPWAHLDIAGVTWAKKDLPLAPKGGTGFGVRLLDRLVGKFYEDP